MDVSSKNKKISKLNKVDIYKAEMEKISFMKEHLEDVPEIFEIGSEKCMFFLIKVFTVLNPNFYYLSLLGQDSITPKLARAASILQLLPSHPNKKSDDIFSNMSEMELHQFWMRFFKLCRVHSSHIASSSSKKSATNTQFQSIFSDMNKAVQYVNHDISIINPTKLVGMDYKKEVMSWVACGLLTDMNDDSLKKDNQHITFEDKEEMNEVNVKIDKLIADIQYITKKADFESMNVSKPVYTYKDFFMNFNESVKAIKYFKDNMKTVSSFLISDLISNTKQHKGSYWLLNTCQLKRCNDIIDIINCKENV